MDLNKTTLSGQIYDILRQDILTQRIRLGEKLTLKHLQERFGVSSTPIREALTRLAEEELVVSYSNIGVNVISIGEQDLKELYEFMGDLDALAISIPLTILIRKRYRRHWRKTYIIRKRF